MESHACANHIRDGIVRPHIVEVGMPAMYLLLGCRYPRKDTPRHCENFTWRVSLIAACQHLVKSPAGGCGAGVDFQRPDAAAGYFGNARFHGDRPHRTHHELAVCATIEQCADNHIAGCTMEGIEK
jgi:hypothetical protein